MKNLLWVAMFVLWSCMPLYASSVTVYSDPTIPQTEFAIGELVTALGTQGYTVKRQPLTALTHGKQDLNVVIASATADLRQTFDAAGGKSWQVTKTEAFSIRITRYDAETTYWAIGADPVGAMYGGLELAEGIRLKGLKGIHEADQEPYIAKRGVKFNIPLDARTPSYGDAGHAAQLNIATMWEMDYWQVFIDDLARYRYKFR